MPALLLIVGERAWRLPRWLSRVIPEPDVDGTRLAESGSTGDPETGALVP